MKKQSKNTINYLRNIKKIDRNGEEFVNMLMY